MMALSHVTIGRTTLKAFDLQTFAMTALSHVTIGHISRPFNQRPHLTIGHVPRSLNPQTCAVTMVLTTGCALKPFNLRVPMSLLIIVPPVSCIWTYWTY
jgi:hypothetical protein